MGVEVIQDQHDAFRLRVVHVDQVLDGMRPILLGAALGHLHMSPAPQRLREQEQIAYPMALVLIVDAGGLARCTA